MFGSPSQRFMTIGMCFSTSWRHYTSNFGRYVPLSLKGSGWLALPSAILLGGILWILNRELTLESLSGVLALLIPAWIVLFLWCNAQSLGELSAISRLVHQSLIVPSKVAAGGVIDVPRETVAEALRFTHSRKFSLLGSAALQWLILGTINAVSFIAVLFGVGMMIAGFGMFNGEPQPGLFLLGGAIVFVSLIVFSWLAIWLSMRFLVTEQALSIETPSGAIASIGRSWKLMKKHALRAFGTIFLAGIICLPIVLVTTIVAQIIQANVLDAVDALPSPSTSPQIVFLGAAASQMIFALLGMLGSIIIAPFIRTVVTTLYFDIRNRKESIEA